MIGGRSALLAASGGVSPYGNWTGNYSDVSLLLRGGVGSGPLGIRDESPTPKTLTNFGGVSINTTTFKYGADALTFTYGVNYLTASSSDFAFGTGDYTIEAWVRPESAAAYQNIFSSRQGAVNDANAISLILVGGTTIWAYSNGILAQGGSLAINGSFYHVAVARQGSSLRLFVDGQQVGTTATNTQNITQQNAGIGSNFNGGENLGATIDDLRITKGIARYTSNFTPPAAQLPANITDDPSYSSVSLLLRGGAATLAPADESSAPKVITVSGNAGISTTTFKYGGSALVAGTSPNFTWGSNRIQVPASSAFAYGTADFTVEAWIYPTLSSDGIFWNQAASGVNYFLCYTSAEGRPAFTFATSGGGTSVVGPAIALNQWSHVAIVRSSGQATVYTNGVGGTAVACTQNFSDTTYIPTIGSYTHNAGSLVYSGLIDDLRVTKGIARYKKNFLPPPAQLPAI
jgi:hypothetical protein